MERYVRGGSIPDRVLRRNGHGEDAIGCECGRLVDVGRLMYVGLHGDCREPPRISRRKYRYNRIGKETGDAGARRGGAVIEGMLGVP